MCEREKFWKKRVLEALKNKIDNRGFLSYEWAQSTSGAKYPVLIHTEDRWYVIQDPAYQECVAEALPGNIESIEEADLFLQYAAHFICCGTVSLGKGMIQIKAPTTTAKNPDKLRKTVDSMLDVFPRLPGTPRAWEEIVPGAWGLQGDE